jgi:hypothetical protein
MLRKSRRIFSKAKAIIARYFEVNSRIIYNIRANETYRHVAPAAKARPLSKLSTIMRRI